VAVNARAESDDTTVNVPMKSDCTTVDTLGESRNTSVDSLEELSNTTLNLDREPYGIVDPRELDNINFNTVRKSNNTTLDVLV
jgi:hypothetical protein